MDTATTEFYTYCHTLSLPDALPISPSFRIDGSGWSPAMIGLRKRPSPRSALRWPSKPFAHAGAGPGEAGALLARAAGAPKPESPVDRKSTRLELQSLMRISYAVFCLKKKKPQQKESMEYRST